MLASLYRKILPYSVRKLIYDAVLGRIIFFFRHFSVICKSKLIFLFGFLLPKTEQNEAYAFIGRYGLTSYPYKYMLEYKGLKISILFDDQRKLPYVVHNNRKLYFPESYTAEKTIKDYRALLIEQDARSSHRYVRSYDELRGKSLLDVGSAEGIFALDTIELTAHVYIFECEDFWLKPLKATFEPWKQKVSFVKKYVGNRTEGGFITLDDFLSDLPKDNLFIKMDIEGAERPALEGAAKTLKSGKNIQLAVCSYHRPGDPEFISKLLSGYGYSCEFSNGLMYWNKRLSKGLIRSHN